MGMTESRSAAGFEVGERPRSRFTFADAFGGTCKSTNRQPSEQKKARVVRLSLVRGLILRFNLGEVWF